MLPRLGILELGGNNLTDIDAINNLFNLFVLNLKDNNISNINFSENFENLRRLDLSGNNITDLSTISNLNSSYYLNSPYLYLDLSRNKNLDLSTLDLNRINKLRLEDCNLEELNFKESNNADEEINDYHSLYLNNNNISDFSSLIDYSLDELDLSGNKNINIETLENLKIRNLILSDCNLDNEKINNILNIITLNELNVSKNPIDDLSFISKQELISLDISDTNIKDLSILDSDEAWIKSIENINASNNKNLIGLNKLSNVGSLELDNCGLDSIEDLKNLENLKNLSINNNNIVDMSAINEMNLSILKADNNKIEDISFIVNNSSLNEISLKNNNISSIGALSGTSGNNNKKIDLSGNKINDLRVRNSINDNIYTTVNEQNIIEEIDLVVGEENSIDFPDMISYSYDQRFKGDISFELNNCSLDLQNKKVIIKSNNLGDGQASIKINGGAYDGSIYTYNYNMKENINVIDIDIEYTGRITFVEGEDFDIENLKVFLVYENGITKETNNYNIENHLDLKPENDLIRISYDEYEFYIDIVVISKDDSRVVSFNDSAVYDYFIMSGWDFENGLIYADNEKKQLVCINDYLDAEGCDINIFDEVSDLTGLSNFKNINYLELYNYNSNDLTEIAGIENLKNLLIINGENSINDISALRDNNTLEGLYLYNTKIKNVAETINSLNLKQITISNIFDVTELEYDDTKVYLPDCYKELLEKCINPEIHVCFNTKYDESEVKQDENFRYYVEFDLDEYEEEELDHREIYVSLYDQETGIDLLNQIDYKLKTDEPEPEEPREIELGYTIKDNKYITQVKTKTTLEDFENKLIGENDLNIQIVSKDNEELVDEEYISTGMKVKLLDESDELLVDSEGSPIIYTVVVKGDINGDGSADLIDSKLIKAHRNEIQGCVLTEEKLEAADINEDNIINFVDSNLLKLHVMEVENYNLDN